MKTWKWGYWISVDGGYQFHPPTLGNVIGLTLAENDYGDIATTIDGIVSPTRATNGDDPDIEVSPEHMQFIADACNEKRAREEVFLRPYTPLEKYNITVIDGAITSVQIITPPDAAVPNENASGLTSGRAIAAIYNQLP